MDTDAQFIYDQNPNPQRKTVRDKTFGEDTTEVNFEQQFLNDIEDEVMGVGKVDLPDMQPKFREIESDH